MWADFTMGLKICSKCTLKKPISDFYKNKHMQDGLTYWCKNCCLSSNRQSRERNPSRGRDWDLKYRSQHREFYQELSKVWYEDNKQAHKLRVFDLTPEHYQILAKQQNNVCGICLTKEEGKELAVDHIHGTKIIRGLLCTLCNLFIGNLRDDIRTIQRASLYLQSDYTELNNLIKSVNRIKYADPKEQRKDAQLSSLYGISLEAYKFLSKVQEEKCAICGDYPRGKRAILFVDHDHKTQQVRGLLCINCNAGIGQSKERPLLLQAAVQYLQPSANIKGEEFYV